MSKEKTFIGLSFTQLLTLIFITLKLTGVITWSWFWVLSPIFIPLMVFGCYMVLVFIIVLIARLKG